MNPKWLGCVLILTSYLAGCGGKASTNPNDYVGEYIFVPDHADPGEFASFVVLKSDHTAVEVRMSKPTGQINISQEKWYLSYTVEENVVIGDFSHPIERSGSRIRLAINEDLGQYYEKVR
jgi:hypothetical protein